MLAAVVAACKVVFAAVAVADTSKIALVFGNVRQRNIRNLLIMSRESLAVVVAAGGRLAYMVEGFHVIDFKGL